MQMFLTETTIMDTRLHAFLNWVLVVNPFNFISASRGFQQLGAKGTVIPMALVNLPIASSRYWYIYNSSATPNVATFFENLR
jgi:hypothetical protein